MKIALIQMLVSPDKEEDLEKARRMVLEAAANGAEMAVLPEMFCCPYANEFFPIYAEERGGHIYTCLSETARDAGLVLVGGSFPEFVTGESGSASAGAASVDEPGSAAEHDNASANNSGARLYNTCFVFDAEGKEIAVHRKAHLFDIDLEGGQHFHESEVFTPGDRATVFDALGHRFGLAICFDIRFAEFFRKMCLMGAEAVILPAAFNMRTGPMHWELLFRMRAVDNQLFTVGTAPARARNGCYVSYANSIVCSPWGKVIARAGEAEEIVYADIDFSENQKARAQLPILTAMRPELY